MWKESDWESGYRGRWYGGIHLTVSSALPSVRRECSGYGGDFESQG